MSPIIEERLRLLDSVQLEAGGHQPDGRYCVMELCAYVAGEPWSDNPACVSPAIGAFLRALNDDLADPERQTLKAYIPRVIGTRTTDEDERRRVWLASDWLVRVLTSAWLDRAGLGDDAAALRALPELTADELAAAALPVIQGARERAAAAWSAAGSAAWSAAGSAAWSAARSAARWAAESAAWSAARSAAQSAAWSAAESAARSALEPTVLDLQSSAFALLDRLIDVGRVEVSQG